MQIRSFLPALLVLLMLSVCVSAQDQSTVPADQDSTGLPGDNFSLQGALEMFKQSSTPEAFEKALNSEENKVNNLDLNADGNIDYIRVINKKEDNIQLFILQAVVSEEESQDIAVISLEKTGDENAIIQIEGDKDIYGEAKIAEPAPEADNAFNYSPASHGPAVASPSVLFVNVWFWPCVRFCYAPAYVVWTSPWGWHSRPGWWRPWRPMPWHYYRPVYYRYNTRYVVVNTRRIPPARIMYRPMRRSSVTVIDRNRVVVNNYRSTRGYQPSRVSNGNPGGRNYQPSRVTNGNNGGRTYQPSRTTNGNNGGRSYQPSRTTNGNNGGRTYQPSNNNGGRSYQSRPSNPGGRNQGTRSGSGGRSSQRSSSGRSRN